MDALAWLGVAVAGGVGAVGRFVVDAAVSRHAGRGLPAGTLVVNVSGAFVLGLLDGAALRGDAYVVAGTAAIGSYTTFSTWMYETQRLGEDGELRGAALNIAVSIVAGLAAAALGRTIGMQL